LSENVCSEKDLAESEEKKTIVRAIENQDGIKNQGPSACPEENQDGIREDNDNSLQASALQ
jgi:hypothetical protein